MSPRISLCSGGVICNQYDEVALVNQCGTSWSFPKGHVESGERIMDAALREIYEEVGLKNLEYIDDLGFYTRSGLDEEGKENKSQTKKIHLFLFFSPKVSLRPIDPDNPEAIWVCKDLVSSYLTHKKDQEFFQKNFQKLGELSSHASRV